MKEETCWCGKSWKHGWGCSDLHSRKKCKFNKEKYHSDNCENYILAELGMSCAPYCNKKKEWIYPL